MNQEEKLLFNKNFNRFLWSFILIDLSVCLGTIVDSVIVGNFINEDGVSAINLSKTFLQFMFTVSMLLSTGAGMLVGMELGKKQLQRATNIFTLSITGCLIFGLLVTLTGLLIPDLITGLLCKNEHLYQPTHHYLVPMLIGAPAFMLSWAMATMVGVDGSPRLVSVAIITANITNLILDITFIKVLGWGIAGSSIATVLGNALGVAIMCRHFRDKDNHLKLVFNNRQQLTIKENALSILAQGAPLAIASVCLTLLLYTANTIVLSTLGRIGIFAFSVCMNLLYIYNLFLSGTCRTVQSLGSIQVGKNDPEALRLVIKKSFRFITLAMILTCIIVWLFPEAITKFFGTGNKEMITEGARALRIFALSFIPFCYIYVLMIVYKLYNYHKMALFISFALSLTVIPILWITSHFHPNLLWYSYLIAYAIEATLIITLHKIGKVKFELNR